MTSGASASRGRLNFPDGAGSELDGRPRLLLAGPSGGAVGVAGRLFRAGAAAVNPDLVAEPVTAPDWADWMRGQLRDLAAADGVALLPSGGGSRGTALLCQLAHEMGLPVRTVPGWLTQLGQDGYMRRLTGGRA